MRKRKKTQHIHKIWPPLLGFFAGLFVISLFQHTSPTISSVQANEDAMVSTTPDAAPIRRKNFDLPYVNPLLFCDTSENKGLNEFKYLKTAAEEVIDVQKQQGGIAAASVYFRDLDPGNWFGINTSLLYAPASLFKVPTAIALYKIAEQNPEILAKKVVYQSADDLNVGENFKPAVSLIRGQAYTVEELLEHMLIYSDNNALHLLQNQIDPGYLNEVFTDLGLSTVGSGDVNIMSVKVYSFAFRALYNSTYLDQQFSNKLLQILTLPDFPQGIRSGVPASIMVAQKFGERTVDQTLHPGVGPKELHDCGIIYYPGHPYFLCIMTQGSDFTRLIRLIHDISFTVFQHMDTIYGPYVPQTGPAQ